MRIDHCVVVTLTYNGSTGRFAVRKNGSLATLARECAGELGEDKMSMARFQFRVAGGRVLSGNFDAGEVLSDGGSYWIEKVAVEQ